MKQDQLLNQILPILHSVKDDEEKLQRILDFLLDEIYEEPDDKLKFLRNTGKLFIILPNLLTVAWFVI